MQANQHVIEIPPPFLVLDLFCPLFIRWAHARWEHNGGLSSLVLIEREARRVIKLSACPATSELLRQQAERQMPCLPLVKRIFGDVGRAFFWNGVKKVVTAFEIEYLEPAPRALAEHLAGQVGAARIDLIQNSPRGIGALELSMATIENFSVLAPEALRPSLDLVWKVVQETEGRFDMQNPDNWMQRHDGTLVMADPVIR